MLSCVHYINVFYGWGCILCCQLLNYWSTFFFSLHLFSKQQDWFIQFLKQALQTNIWWFLVNQELYIFSAGYEIRKNMLKSSACNKKKKTIKHKSCRYKSSYFKLRLQWIYYVGYTQWDRIAFKIALKFSSPCGFTIFFKNFK